MSQEEGQVRGELDDAVGEVPGGQDESGQPLVGVDPQEVAEHRFAGDVQQGLGHDLGVGVGPRALAATEDDRDAWRRTLGPVRPGPCTRLIPEPGEGAFEAVAEPDGRFPAELASGDGEVRAPHLGVVDRTRGGDDVDVAAGDVPDRLGQLADRHLLVVTDVDGVGVAGDQQPEDALDEVVDVAQRPGLAAVAVQR